MSQASNITDAFRALGLKPGADRPAVKKAYRRLAKILHPDLNPNADPGRMAKVNRAYRAALQYLEEQSRPWSPFNLQDFQVHARQARPRPAQAAPKAEEPPKPAHPAGRAPQPPLAAPYFGPLAADPAPENARPHDPHGWRLIGLVRRGDALVYQVELSGNPASISLPLRGTRQCAACAGRGSLGGPFARKVCPSCGGRGRITASGQVEVALPGVMGEFEVHHTDAGAGQGRILVELRPAAHGKAK